MSAHRNHATCVCGHAVGVDLVAVDVTTTRFERDGKWESESFDWLRYEGGCANCGRDAQVRIAAKESLTAPAPEVFAAQTFSALEEMVRRARCPDFTWPNGSGSTLMFEGALKDAETVLAAIAKARAK